jgi:hypothetical protein
VPRGVRAAFFGGRGMLLLGVHCPGPPPQGGGGLCVRWGAVADVGVATAEIAENEHMEGRTTSAVAAPNASAPPPWRAQRSPPPRAHLGMAPPAVHKHTQAEENAPLP